MARNVGGWLDGEPDDGDCSEDGAEDFMVMKFNVNEDVTSHGFSDVDSTRLRRALISRIFTAGDPGADPTYERLWVREFRYDGARQRYLVRELNTSTLVRILGNDAWTEYVGNTPVADYQPDGGGTSDTEFKRYWGGLSLRFGRAGFSSATWPRRLWAFIARLPIGAPSG